MNRVRRFIGLSIIVGIGTSASTAQTTPTELFNTILKGGLVKTTGLTRVTWLPEGMGYLETERATGGWKLFRVNPADGNRALLFDAETESAILGGYNAAAGTTREALPFADFEYVLEDKAIRYAAGGKDYLYSISDRATRQLKLPKLPDASIDGRSPAQTMSPDLTSLAYVSEGDLWVCDTTTGATRRLTTRGNDSSTVGVVGSTIGFVWSPGSRRIVYIRADESALQLYPIVHDLDRDATVEWQRYPFVSGADTNARIRIVDVETGAEIEVAAGLPGFPHLRNLAWTLDGSKALFQRVNKRQNTAELVAADASTGETQVVLTEEDEWFLNPLDDFLPLADGNHFVWTSERSGFRHLYIESMDGAPGMALTNGDWEVGRVHRVDEVGGWVYFDAYLDRGMTKAFHRTRLDGSGVERLTPEDGTHEITLDPDAKYFLDDYATLTTPRTLRLFETDGAIPRVTGTSDDSAAKALGLSSPERIVVTAADGETPLDGLLFRPADFDSSRRYPLVVSIYGGPHAKLNADSYLTTDYRAALAQLGFLVWELDARGTPYRGKKFQAGNYMKWGQIDADDQAAAVRQLSERAYVDATRVGVFGLSHGGYMTCMLMVRYPDVFHAGVAGAPLTDLHNGPMDYVGRCMRTPDENPEGYELGSVLHRAEALRGHLLIYHGTNDHNALLVNTMQLVERLVKAGKPVETMIYPGGDHVMTGAYGLHVFKTTATHFLRHLRPEQWDASIDALWTK